MVRWRKTGDDLSCPDPNLLPLYREWVSVPEKWILARRKSGADINLRHDIQDCLLDAMARLMDQEL